MPKEKEPQGNPENHRTQLFNESKILSLPDAIFHISQYPKFSKDDLNDPDDDQFNPSIDIDRNRQLQHLLLRKPVKPDDLRFQEIIKDNQYAISVIDYQGRLIKQSILQIVPREQWANPNIPEHYYLTESNFYYLGTGKNQRIVELVDDSYIGVTGEYVYDPKLFEKEGRFDDRAFVSQERTAKAILSVDINPHGPLNIEARRFPKNDSIQTNSFQFEMWGDSLELLTNTILGSHLIDSNTIIDYHIVHDYGAQEIKVKSHLFQGKKGEAIETKRFDVYGYVSGLRDQSTDPETQIPIVSTKDFIPFDPSEMNLPKNDQTELALSYSVLLNNKGNLLGVFDGFRVDVPRVELRIPDYPLIYLAEMPQGWYRKDTWKSTFQHLLERGTEVDYLFDDGDDIDQEKLPYNLWSVSLFSQEELDKKDEKALLFEDDGFSKGLGGDLIQDLEPLVEHVFFARITDENGDNCLIVLMTDEDFSLVNFFNVYDKDGVFRDLKLENHRLN